MDTETINPYMGFNHCMRGPMNEIAESVCTLCIFNKYVIDTHFTG